MVTAESIYNLLNENFPFDTQESWDNSGLLVNSREVTDSVLVCLDVTHEAVEKAVEVGAKIIVSHHPVIFNPIKHINNNDVVYSLIKHDISVVSAHTNFDKYDYGTCYAMAEILNLEPLDSSDIEIGLLTKADFTAKELAERCKRVFGAASCTLPENELSKIFICEIGRASCRERV